MAGATNRGPGRAGSGRQQHSSGGVMGSVKDTAQEFASSVGDQSEQAWDYTRQQAQNVASSVASGAGEAWDELSVFFRRYPVPMFFAGVGLGFLLAMAFGNMPANMTRRMSEASDR